MLSLHSDALSSLDHLMAALTDAVSLGTLREEFNQVTLERCNPLTGDMPWNPSEATERVS